MVYICLNKYLIGGLFKCKCMFKELNELNGILK